MLGWNLICMILITSYAKLVPWTQKLKNICESNSIFISRGAYCVIRISKRPQYYLVRSTSDTHSVMCWETHLSFQRLITAFCVTTPQRSQPTFHLRGAEQAISLLGFCVKSTKTNWLFLFLSLSSSCWPEHFTTYKFNTKQGSIFKFRSMSKMEDGSPVLISRASFYLFLHMPQLSAGENSPIWLNFSFVISVWCINSMMRDPWLRPVTKVHAPL